MNYQHTLVIKSTIAYFSGYKLQYGTSKGEIMVEIITFTWIK
jgi:hypothetical protein